MNIEKVKTSRGFALLRFKDLYHADCSIQKSSLADDDAIWIGVDNAQPQVLHGDATKLGIKHNETSGWVPYPIPEEVSLTTRMHLNRDQVKELIPILQQFVESGEV